MPLFFLRMNYTTMHTIVEEPKVKNRTPRWTGSFVILTSIPFIPGCGCFFFQILCGSKLFQSIYSLLFVCSSPAGTGDIMDKNKHLTIESRKQIEAGLDNCDSFKAIGKVIGKDCTTVSKEVRNHRVFIKTGSFGHAFNDCSQRFTCTAGMLCNGCRKNCRNNCRFCKECLQHCREYSKENCALLEKPPYVCNGCSQRSRCTLEKAFYRAYQAQKEYEDVRSESRSGFDITEEELSSLNQLISPLLRNGQSIHHICTNNPDLLPFCEKTIYSYVDARLIDAMNMDLPRKVRRRIRKKKSVEMKVDKSCRISRTYDDFLQFMKDHPDLPVVQIDSVEGIKGSAVLLTIYFVKSKLQLAFKRACNNSQSVTDIFNWLYETLGPDTYRRLFPTILADNGTEFSNPKAIESDSEGNRRSYVFYCNPSAPHEKGACENNHEFIRRIIPKGYDIALYSVSQIDLMMSHINSYARPDLGDKTPYEVFSFMYGDDILPKLRQELIPANEIILRPSLIRPKQKSV